MKSFPTHWGIPPQDWSANLGSDTVHVWRIILDDSPDRAARYRSCLSSDERARADRCRVPHPQYQFIVTRAILRILLSRYVKIPPMQLHIDTQPQGKPVLRLDSTKPIHFNVSHTKGMAFIALASRLTVGVDIERVDRNIQHLAIVQRYFSRREADSLASLPPEEQIHQFFAYWTCKEAYLKMLGRGIAEGLADCELTLDQDQARATLSPSSHSKEPCSLFRITAGTVHVGAVAASSSDARVMYWNWSDELLC